MNQSQSVKIVIIYDQFPAGIRAKQMSERLAVQLKSDCEAWATDWLTLGLVREHAAMMAARANMIIIIAHGREELQPEVKDWIESWLDQRTPGPAVLVGLLADDSPSSKQSPRICAYLNCVAQRGGMDFICNQAPWMPARDQDFDSGKLEPDPADVWPAGANGNSNNLAANHQHKGWLKQPETVPSKPGIRVFSHGLCGDRQ
jgi:hypothetical protein